MQLYGSLNILWHCPSLGVNENWPFPVPWPQLSFVWHTVWQICWHIVWSTFTAASFRILDSSARYPLLPLALFIIILSKACLTSHSRMSGSRWVTTPLWLSGSLRLFLYSSYMYSWDLFLIPSASVRLLLYLSFIVPILAWNVPLISPSFLEEVASLCHSTVFLCLFTLFM